MLRAAEIGLLATVGRIKGVKVYRRPVIGLLSTGNELVDAGSEELEDGKIRDSNKLMLKAIIKEYQVAGEVKDYGTVSDREDSLHEAM